MSKTKIKALILDYGNVISQPQRSKNVINILGVLNVDQDAFREIYLRERTRYDSGQISGEEYWRNIILHFDLDPDGLDIGYLIREDVKSWTRINQSMIDFIHDSRPKIQKLAIVSNMTEDSLTYIRTHFQWLELFDVLVFSFELGVNKPDKRIYQACLQKLLVSANQCLFVDDSVENVIAARETGMNAMHFTTNQKFLADLHEEFAFTL